MKHMEVIDEQGVHLQSTYERRARGLARKGRTYYVTASCICLFAPPENVEEETLKANNKKNILTRIGTILQQKGYLQKVFSTIKEIPYNLNEELTAIRMKAILEIVEARGRTNKEVVALFHAALDQDVIPQGK